MRWKVWYDDQPPWTSQDGQPELTPGLGVLVVVQTDPDNGRYILAGDPYFWWEHDRWWSGDLFGCWDYLSRPGCRKVLFGRQVSNDRYQQTLRAADQDPDFAPRTAWRPGEPHLPELGG